MLMEHLPLKTAVKLAADITGEPRNTLYPLALAMKSAAAGQDSSEISESPT
jgi:16S rRNA (cytidine1402-2'-O)-methyltransferase